VKEELQSRPSSPAVRQIAGALIALALVAVAGLFYVKWWPYYNRILTVSGTHTMGGSIFGKQGYFTSATLGAAWAYTVKYFNSVWKAAVLGIILAGAVEAVLPTTWVERYLSGKGFRSTLVGGLVSLPGMMCTCCATPVVVGLRKRNASTGAAVAFWLGNPALNPATLTVLFLVLGWQFGAIRLVLGLIAVFGISYGLDRLAHKDQPAIPDLAPAAPAPQPAGPQEHWALRWVKASLKLAVWIVPEYLVIVGLTGFLGGLFFPQGIGTWAHGFLPLILIALAGTLFVVPTMAEIPIVQGLMAIGLPVGPAMALLLTLPTISLPSLVMAGRSFQLKTLVTIALAVAAVGVIGGLAATVLI
jgi:uncharacterized membrane protein YraQ (UPF0718 family)